MKLYRVAVCVGVLSLAACASTTPPRAEVPAAQPVQAVQAAQPTQPVHPYALPAQPVRTVAPAPAWYVRLPESTNEMVFAAGVGSSTDEQMAYDKARMFAEQKLVEQTRSVIQSQTKSYRNDTGSAMIESFETVLRKNANGELIGAQRVDSHATFDGRQYKVYVLLRLPLGEANIMARERQSQQLRREADLRGARAQQELDRAAQTERQEQERQDQKLQQTIGPDKPQSHVAPVTVPTTSGQSVQLLDVDNAEYKKKREEALQKPGAVIGQTTLR